MEQSDTPNGATGTTSPTEAEGRERQSQGPNGSESEPSGGTEIMASLPRARPQRRSERRTGSPAARRQATAKRTAATERARQVSAARSRTRTPGTRPSRSVSEQESEPSRAGEAPGLPRLATDAAVQAALLPVKVGAQVTFRALDAIARSLRRS